MHRVVSFLFGIMRIVMFSLLGAFLVIARYLARTPQTLESPIAGEARSFEWIYGHIFYTVSGSPDAPPLVMLHTPEIGGSSYELRGIAEPLARHYRVYALDLLGFGLSARPNIHYSGETYTALVRDFLTEVVKKPATLLASGGSCNYSIAIAERQPELCERLILLSPNTLLLDRRADTQYQFLRWCLQNSFVGLFVYALLTGHAVLHYVVARQQGMDAERVRADELDHAYAAAHQYGGQHAANAWLAGHLFLDVSRQIEMLRTPMILLWGARATNADWSIAALYSANEQAQGVLIQNANAWPHREQPAEVVTQLLTWYTPTTAQETEALVTASVSTAEHGTRDIVLETPHILVEKQQAEVAPPLPQVTEIAPPQEASSEDTVARAEEQVEAYCVKCKEKRFMVNPESTVTKNGRNAKVGTCPVCGTKLFRFVAS